jgi:hypothetical protein
MTATMTADHAKRRRNDSIREQGQTWRGGGREQTAMRILGEKP